MGTFKTRRCGDAARERLGFQIRRHLAKYRTLREPEPRLHIEVMRVVSVRVPATSANLGPGFDCLGLALQLYNVVKVRRGTTTRDAFVRAAAKSFFNKSGLSPFAIDWEVTGDVPRARGLGSSVTVRLGILHGLNELAGTPLDGDALYSLCAELEGHPDNAAPAAYGGFTVARTGGVQRFRVGRELEFSLLIPEFPVPTAEARGVLPKKVSLAHAVRSLGNACAIVGAFSTRRYAELAGCFDDDLHQPYRAKLVPCLGAVLEAGQKAGALGGWLSGSGSTIACLSVGSGARVAKAMRRAAGDIEAKVVVVRADNAGVRILRSSRL